MKKLNLKSFRLFFIFLSLMMGSLTTLHAQDQAYFNKVGKKHGFSADAVECVYQSLLASGGQSASFNHSELGGMGQWMQGMVMIGDMFNNKLKGKVDKLASEISADIAQVPTKQKTKTEKPSSSFSSSSSSSSFQPMQPMQPMKMNFQPMQSGGKSASMSGGQNGFSYQYFKDEQLIEINNYGQVSKIQVPTTLVSISQVNNTLKVVDVTGQTYIIK